MNMSESARNKWIAGGAVLVILLAGGSIARIRSLQRQAAPDNPIALAAAINARLALTPDEQAQRLKLVTHLRETWKPWARAHQDELRRMLKSQPSDTLVRDAVWNSIPRFPGENKELVVALNLKGNGAKGEVFTWNALSTPKPVAKIIAMPADEKNRYKREIANADWSIKNEFAEKRDLTISQSTQTGGVSVSLWVSGRVTEDTPDDRKINSPEGFAISTYKRKQILPAYDFLTAG